MVEHQEAVARLIQERDIQTVFVGTPDPYGVLRGKAVSAEQFVKETLRHGLLLSDYIYGVDVHDDIIDPGEPRPAYWPSLETGFADIRVIPDLSTFCVMPWRDRAAIVLADAYDMDGVDLVDVAPRNVLRRVIDRTAEMGFAAAFGCELEFFVLEGDVYDNLQEGFRKRKPMYPERHAYGIQEHLHHDDLLGALRRCLDQMGLGVLSSNPEGSAGQWEINLTHHDPLRAADFALLLKLAVKDVVALSGKTATFMAKPDDEEFGNSLHLHQSLAGEDGRNTFFDPTAPHEISDSCRSYIAGLLEGMRELTLMIAPNINSYRRFQSGMLAGDHLTWAIDNRTTGVRILVEGEHGTRVELRSPGADANPYFAIAGSLAAGLHGLENSLSPPDPTSGNSYALNLSPDQQICKSLPEAIDAFQESQLARKYLGDRFVDHFAAYGRHESLKFGCVVTDWERVRYWTKL